MSLTNYGENIILNHNSFLNSRIISTANLVVKTYTITHFQSEINIRCIAFIRDKTIFKSFLEKKFKFK